MKKSEQNRKHFIQHWQIITVLLLIYDIVAVNAAYFLALLLRFDFSYSQIEVRYLEANFAFMPYYTVICVAVFWLFKLYRSLWRFASYRELANMFLATAVTFALNIAVTMAFFIRMPISYYVIGIILQFVLTLGVRFSYRFVLLMLDLLKKESKDDRIMLIGAGNAGQQVLRDISGNGIRGKVVCIIDDNPNKHGRFIDNVPIIGGRDEILSGVEKYEVNKIYLAIPSASAAEKRDILAICNETECELMSLPGLSQIMNGQVSVSNLRAVAIEDLLGREPIKADMSGVYAFIKGKTVLVTGGGGSIGSELCRQVAAHEPKTLIIFDIYENNAYSIQLELKAKYPKLDLVVLIGSVRDKKRITQVFEKYHPDVVYHAAAHKHVPLMEDSPCESIKNNVLGTYNTAFAAMHSGCSRFVLISTDKAVNPTNIMGASKRLCEMVIQSFAHRVECSESFSTCFAAVRFGNVLGSNGSVVPIFRKQIEQGGPVTVTHPDIIRYFMTVPEAVSLVMLAGTFAGGGEIFVLDMGSPVKIDTLARNLIRLSGLKPDEDIKIEYTGLRPGEKLYEEKLMAEEGLEKTENDLIHIGKPIAFDYEQFDSQLAVLESAAYDNKESEIRSLVREVVSTYHPVEN